MRIKKKAFQCYLLASIFVAICIYVLILIFGADWNNTWIGSLSIGFLASLLVLSGSTYVEYLITKKSTILHFIQKCYWYLSLSSEACLITRSKSHILTSYEKWMAVNTYYENDLKQAFFDISFYRGGKIKFNELSGFFNDIISLHDGLTQNIIINFVAMLGLDSPSDLENKESISKIQVLSNEAMTKVAEYGLRMLVFNEDRGVNKAVNYFKQSP